MTAPHDRLVQGPDGRFLRESKMKARLEELNRKGLIGVPKLRHIDILVPSDLLHRIKLIRHLTGIPLREWCTWQLMMAADLELSRRPGTLWLRPGSRIYRMELAAAEPVPTVIATSLGGERVWVIEVIPDLRLGDLDDQLPDGMAGAGIVCDISATEADHLDLRRVVVAACDVLPREPMPWTTGFFTLKDAKRREKQRRTQDLAHLFAKTEAEHNKAQEARRREYARLGKPMPERPPEGG